MQPTDVDPSSFHRLRLGSEDPSARATVHRGGAFGEFLVGAGALDRYQLFRALQAQDACPGARLGECAAALGFVDADRVEVLHGWYATTVAG
jgi:hypothetical protein